MITTTTSPDHTVGGGAVRLASYETLKGSRSRILGSLPEMAVPMR
ncbi:MAG: hypothetical protein ACJAT6_001850 [Akkermansiaceae bacterium]|jgi:hypothetical protein